ncbi:hypothetical protein Peur_053465 [Populus x canadensis]
MQMIVIHLPRINVLRASNTRTEVQSNSHGNSSAMTSTAIFCHSICSSATNLERKTFCEKSCQLRYRPTTYYWPPLKFVHRHFLQDTTLVLDDLTIPKALDRVTLLSLEIWTPRNAYLKACGVPGHVRRDKQISSMVALDVLRDGQMRIALGSTRGAEIYLELAMATNSTARMKVVCIQSLGFYKRC